MPKMTRLYSEPMTGQCDCGKVLYLYHTSTAMIAVCYSCMMVWELLNQGPVRQPKPAKESPDAHSP
jgi:hypothetical protein